MPVDIDIRLGNVGALLKRLDRFDTDVAQAAAQQALNRAINNMRTEAIKLAAPWLGVPRSAITKRFRFNIKTKHGGIGIKGAKRRIRMEATAVARGRPFNMIRFGAVATKGGITSGAWGTQKFYKDHGIARNPASFVFLVNTKAKEKNKRVHRGAYGPGLTQALSDQTIIRAVEKLGGDQYLKHFKSAANFQLKKAGYRVRI